ncbi:MAG TPA: P-loop NTPase [Gemmatimonadaceae bacterium]|nr:P-loop NTPase [Gemmatimonadaceae bacterium]
MDRKALIVAGAAGPQDIANGVLQRFGFAPATLAHSVSDAAVLLRTEHYDLVVVPLQGTDPMDLASLDREVRRHRTTFVIGTAAQSDSDLILRAMRSGIQEFLLYPPEPKDFSGAVERLMRRTHADRKAGTAIAVYSGKGGIGTSTVAVNLAFALARNRPDGRVALADMIASGGDVKVMLDLRPTYDMSDVVRKMDRIDTELLDSLLTPTSRGVWVLPASDNEEAAEVLDGAATTSLVDQLRSQFAYTVIDCEHHMSERTLAVLDGVDRILLVTQLNVSALRSAQRTLSLFQRLGYADDKVHVVVNRYQSGDIVTIPDAQQVLKREIYFKLPNDYQTAAGALTKGVPVAEHDPESHLAWGYSSLASRIEGAPTTTAELRAANRSNGSRLGRLFSIGRK